MKKDKALALHLIQYCKEKGIKSEPAPAPWVLVSLKDVPEINSEIERYYEKKKNMV